GDAPDPVGGRRRLEPVTFDAVGEDRGDPPLGHLPVRLVLEPLDVTGGSLEGDDGARRSSPDQARDGLDRERLLHNRGPHSSGPGVATRSPAYRWNEGQLVPRPTRHLRTRVLQVDGHRNRHPLEDALEAWLECERLDRIADR